MPVEKIIADRLLKKAAELLEASNDSRSALKELCLLLKKSVPHYDWVGFYLVDTEKPDELVLGPFDGAPTEHTRIKFGRGICGQAAATGKTFVVDDVTRESNYLACSLHVKSEIVLPIFTHGRLTGELDIDSHTPAAFDDSDEVFLKIVCDMVSEII